MTRERPRFERHTWWFAFFAFVVTGVGWTMAMPLLGQPDEPSHAQRAAAVAQGQLTWKAREEFVYTEFFFVRRTNTVIDVPEGYATLEDIPVCFAFNDGRDATCAPEISSDRQIVEARPYTGTYPPLTAILQSPGGFFDAPVGLVVMRLCTVLVTAALLSSAVVAVRRLGGGPRNRRARSDPDARDDLDHGGYQPERARDRGGRMSVAVTRRHTATRSC